jgi:hypothetical protein
MRLIGCGDSWAWGAELVDPNEEPVPIMKLEGDNFWRQIKPINTAYREKHRYVNILGNKLNATEVVDLSKPAYSNEAIFRVLLQWLSQEGYTEGRDTSDLFVSVGWSSPERREFYTNRGKDANFEEYYFEFGPWSAERKHGDDDWDMFFKLYVLHFWKEKEFIRRWIHDVYKTEVLLKHLGIKYLMHQAFYHHYLQPIHHWDDKKYKEKGFRDVELADKKLWATIDSTRFLNKDDNEIGTCHHYLMKQVNNDKSKVLLEWHPNEYGHQLWADYLYEYITKNNLC